MDARTVNILSYHFVLGNALLDHNNCCILLLATVTACHAVLTVVSISIVRGLDLTAILIAMICVGGDIPLTYNRLDRAETIYALAHIMAKALKMQLKSLICNSYHVTQCDRRMKKTSVCYAR